MREHLGTRPNPSHCSSSSQPNGTVNAHVYNAGRIHSSDTISITKNYHESSSSKLRFFPSRSPVAFAIGGEAVLGGTLVVGKSSAKNGQTITVLTAKKITNRFSNPNDEVIGEDGTIYKIAYSDTKVILTAK